MKVDSEAIAQLTHHLRQAAGEIPVEPAVTRMAAGDFASPVADAVSTSNTDLVRQASAISEFIEALASAGDQAAERLLAIDAAVASHATPHGRRGPTVQ